MALQKIKKRNGSIVDFDRMRIEEAMKHAFHAVGTRVNDNFFPLLTDDIVAILEERFSDRMPGVENVQDVVEKIIAQRGYFEVARAYIIYRYEHTKVREQKQREFFEKIENDDLTIVKRSGKKERFSLQKLMNCIAHFTHDLDDGVNSEVLAKQCRLELYEGIGSADVFRSLIMTARSFIEQDPAYSRLASRLLRHALYWEVIGDEIFDVRRLDTQYRQAFIKNIRKGVEIGRLDPRMLTFDLDVLARQLVLERDDFFQYLGTQVLYDRYFLRDPYEKQVLETPQAFWMRVAMGVSLLEKNKTDVVTRFYTILSTLRFVATTPTLFHSGTLHPQLSACYLNTVEDSLDHIFKVIADNAQLSKWSGGIGSDWTNVRATGSLIQGIGVESQGVIPFLKVANDTTHAINRSGRRRGAACVYLETWHYDIEDFLELRKNTGDERRRTHDMDTAHWIPDLFMKRVREDGEWTLFSPHEVPDLHHIYGRKFEERYAHYESRAREGELKMTKVVKARDLWKKMLSMLYETGHPWITFKDPSNVRSPQDHVGVIHNSNLCTEITLNNSAEETAVCNLGSVNLGRHIKDDGVLDHELIADTVRIAMRFLDNVIDVNFYPTKEARVSNLRHRPVGLGIMGFQDALYMLNIRFDSDECVQFADESMELISYHALLASSLLAKERGTYQTYTGSKWDRGIFPVDTLDILEHERGEKIDIPRAGKLDWRPVRESVRMYGVRNSNCFAIAPTATIGNISGTTFSIEPSYKNIYVKSNMSGDFIIINPYLVKELKQLNLWDYEMLGKIKYHDGSIQEIHEIPEHVREKYKEVFEIDPLWLVKAAAHRGKWIDQSQSLNLFFKGVSGKKIADVYMYAWSLGIKTTYYMRTLAVSQVEKSTVNAATYGSTHTRKSDVVESLSSRAGVTAENIDMRGTGREETEMLAAAAVVATTAVSPEAPSQQDSMAQLCKIDDPDCESCQ